MDEKWMGRIEDKLDRLTETNFTKKDMEIFKNDICSPSRACQVDHDKRIQKTEKFQARIGGIVAAVSVIWGILIVFLELKSRR